MCILRTVGDLIVFSEVLIRTGLHDFFLEKIRGRVVPSNINVAEGRCGDFKVFVTDSEMRIYGMVEPDYCPSFVPVFDKYRFITGVAIETAIKLCYNTLPREARDKVVTRPGRFVDEFFVLTRDGEPIRFRPDYIGLPIKEIHYRGVMDYLNDVLRTCCR